MNSNDLKLKENSSLLLRFRNPLELFYDNSLHSYLQCKNISETIESNFLNSNTNEIIERKSELQITDKKPKTESTNVVMNNIYNFNNNYHDNGGKVLNNRASSNNNNLHFLIDAIHQTINQDNKKIGILNFREHQRVKRLLIKNHYHHKYIFLFKSVDEDIEYRKKSRNSERISEQNPTKKVSNKRKFL